MKSVRCLTLVVALLVLSTAMTAMAGEYLTKWSDWSSMDRERILHRVRCHKADPASHKYLWDIEVENHLPKAAKIGVALSFDGQLTPPMHGWVTWPVNAGGRHKFSGYLFAAGPNEPVQVWVKNFTAKAQAAQSSWKRYSVDTPKADSYEGRKFLGCGKEWLLGKVDVDWNAAQTWIRSLGDGWRTPTKAELIELFQQQGQNSPVGQNFVWAERRDQHSAWNFSFYYQEPRWRYLDDHSIYGRAVAVRNR